MIGRDANAIVVDFKGETAVRMAHPDNNSPGPGGFRRFADGLLTDAEGRNFYRCREYQKITRYLESNGRRAAALRGISRVVLGGAQQE